MVKCAISIDGELKHALNNTLYRTEAVHSSDQINIYEMGCSSPQNATLPNIPAHHLNRLLQVADINHQLNVNKKYEHLSKIRDGIFVGTGFKRSMGYDCLTTLEELRSKRKEFWETRVNGSPECWNAIKMAVEEPDQNTGQAILLSVRITMLNNSIQMCVDHRFNKYEVPVFCLSEPMSFCLETIAEKNLNYTYDDTALTVKIRSVKWPTEDITLSLNASMEVSAAKKALRDCKQVPEKENIRFFYNGRQMIDNKTLGNYNYSVGTIIQAMIR